MDRAREAGEIRIGVESWLVGCQMRLCPLVPPPFGVMGVDRVTRNPDTHTWTTAVLLRISPEDADRARKASILGFTITDLVRMRALLNALDTDVDGLLARHGM